MSRLRVTTFRTTLALALASAVVGSALAQGEAGSVNGAAAQAAMPIDEGPVAIPISAIAVQASALDGIVRNVESSFEAPDAQLAIADAITGLEKDVAGRARLMRQKLEGAYDRADLDSLKSSWRGLLADLARWESTLASRLETLDRHQAELGAKRAVWDETARAAREEKAPAEVRSAVSEALATLEKTGRGLRKSRNAALGLQRNVVALKGRVEAQLEAIANARGEVLRHVLRRNQPPVWALEAGDLEQNRKSFASAVAQAQNGLQSYASKQSGLLAFHGALIAFLIVACVRARRSVLRTRDTLGRAVPAALEHPVAAALVLGLTMTVWLQPDAPPTLGQILTLIVLPFWLLVLHRVVPEALRPTVRALGVIVPLELTRELLVDFDTLARLLLILESAVVLAGAVWLRRSLRLAAAPWTAAPLWTRMLSAWLHFSLFASAVTLAGSIAGFTTAADMLGRAVVSGTFAGSILFTAVRVAEGIAEGSAFTGQLRRIRVIHHDPGAFLRVVERAGRTLAFATWCDRLLDYLSIQGPVYGFVGVSLSQPLGYGAVQVTLGGLLAFALALWVSWLLSRFVSQVLEQEIFSRVGRMPRGVDLAVSTISRYAVLVLGFVTAIAALGVEVGNLALLVSALGVGIGFGMQNVVNNFISGLILLFERPIKVGDRISIESLLGEVTSIGIRASTIRTFDGADVLVPNGDLISNQVTNWTLSDARRRVILPIRIAYGTPAVKVISLLLEIARGNPDVLQHPEPVAIFSGFGDSALDFELRIWTESGDALTLVRSALGVAVQDALAQAGIEIPLPQRDLHLKTVPGAQTAPEGAQ